ncbi:MAG: hypothetical protein CVU39_25875 [Chloroflexi bacterium HGW-Chloroflexi-10]|nr:MAG: hypothetical protein CVU39_25875 [Chloroflexi bacterium HGW-Chloroflexi-10]
MSYYPSFHMKKELFMTQRMFHGNIRAAALADQLTARFHERHTRVNISSSGVTALVQIGSQHGTPVTVHITDTDGGVLVTMGRDRDWIDRASDVGGMIERAASAKPISILAMIPEMIGEMNKGNIVPQIWDAINELCALTQALAGEKEAPQNPRICSFCQTPNQTDQENCISCGAALPVDLPRVCPKCSRAHTSDALFCQACGSRLIIG